MSDPAVFGLIGVAVGFTGSVLATHLTNEAAERRLRIQLRDQDRTRFHKERAELYGKVLALSQTSRSKIVEYSIAHKNQDDESVSGQFLLSAISTMTELGATTKTVILLGAPETRDAASALFGAASEFFGKSHAPDEAVFEKANDMLREAEDAFADAARAELFPSEEKAS